MPNEGSAPRMPVQDTGKYQNCLQPPSHGLGAQLPPPSLGEEPGAIPSEEEREIWKNLPKYRECRGARGRWGCGA